MSQSIFSFLNYQVLSHESGVYHLQRSLGPGAFESFVGVLHTEDELKAPVDVKLFLFKLEDGVDPHVVMNHWKNLDARRLEQSGIEPVTVELGKEYFYLAPVPVEFQRPDGFRVRHAMRLQTGDVVCLN